MHPRKVRIPKTSGILWVNATLPRVRAFDYANPWEGLRITPTRCNFTSRSHVRPRQSMGKVARGADKLEKKCNFASHSRVRPRQSMVRVARHADKVQLYLAFARSTTPIHGKGCASRRKVATIYTRVHTFDHALQSMGRVARGAAKVQLYHAFTRSTTPIHGKGCAWRRHVGKNVQLYLAFARSTTPIHGKSCASRRQGRSR